MYRSNILDLAKCLIGKQMELDEMSAKCQQLESDLKGEWFHHVAESVSQTIIFEIWSL